MSNHASHSGVAPSENIGVLRLRRQVLDEFSSLGSLLTTRHHWPPGLYHEVERALSLVGAVGYHTRDAELVLSVPVSARRQVRRFLAAEADNASGPLIVMHPGCSMPACVAPGARTSWRLWLAYS